MSEKPTAGWVERFVETWNHPPQFTSMHRPGIAFVEADRVILDGTNLDEVRKYHRDTLKLAVEVANRQLEASDETEHMIVERADAQRRKHQDDVRAAANEISFEGDTSRVVAKGILAPLRVSASPLGGGVRQ